MGWDWDWKLGVGRVGPRATVDGWMDGSGRKSLVDKVTGAVAFNLTLLAWPLTSVKMPHLKGLNFFACLSFCSGARIICQRPRLQLLHRCYTTPLH